jgi:SAM-dependent methyltransferase
MGRIRAWWLDQRTDRMARRPRGRRARAVYGAPEAHSFAWEPVLDALRLGPDDVLLDAGCGGGAFLRRALEIDCRAAGVDHSRTMVRLARRTNADAVASGRLRVVHGAVEDLPFRDGEFTALSCLVAFLFFERPVHVLRERCAACSTGAADGLRSSPFPRSCRAHRPLPIRFQCAPTSTLTQSFGGYRSRRGLPSRASHAQTSAGSCSSRAAS